jgi:putative ABC transport system permease protein
MLTDFFLYSLRNLGKRKLRTALTLLGIIVGIASVITLTTLGEGLRLAITSQFSSVSTDIITIQASGVQGYGPPGTGVASPLKKDYAPDISKLPGVELAVGRMISTFKAEFNDIQDFVFAGSMPDGDGRKLVQTQLALKIEEGRALRDGDSGKVVLGHNYASNDNYFKRAVHAGDRILINSKSFEVVGIMKKAGSFIVDSVVLMNEEDQRDLSGNKENVNLIVVKVKDLRDMDAARDNINRYLRKERDVKVGEEDFSVETPQQALESVNSILGGIQAFIVIIASISMIVGAVGIINTMFTAVLERRKEIGVMKAIGARNSDIFSLFLIESGLIGLVGGFIGVTSGKAIGILGILSLNNFLGVTAGIKWDFSLMLITLVGSFILGAVAGIVPAMQAAKMAPVNALRS